MYRISAMTRECALMISQWKYDGEYSLYSFEQNQETLDELLGGDYFVCEDARGDVVGYFCLGKAARIPTMDFDYPDNQLDIGLGMHPALCGKGMGYDFLLCGLKHFSQMNPRMPFRLTVACFNERAISLYKRIGFAIEGVVAHRKTGKPFYVMVEESALTH